MNVLDLALWGAQGFLALFFLGAGAPKILGRGLDRWTGFEALPRSQVIVTGFAEVLGAAALILPMVTGTLPWLTPLAAVGLVIIGLMAAGFHVRADERPNIGETSLLAAIAGVIAIGRWDLFPPGAEVLPGVLVAALGLLVPAAIINVIFLARQPVASDPPAADRGDHLEGEALVASLRTTGSARHE